MDVQLKMEPTSRLYRPSYRISIVYTHTPTNTTTYLLHLQVPLGGGVNSGGNTARQGLWVAVAWLGFWCLGHGFTVVTHNRNYELVVLFHSFVLAIIDLEI